MSDDIPTHWPTGVEPLTIDGSGKIGVHRDTGHLYWDGKRVSTVGRLAFPERALAVVATAPDREHGASRFGSFSEWQLADPRIARRASCPSCALPVRIGR